MLNERMQWIFSSVFDLSTRIHAIPCEWVPSAPVLKLRPITRWRDRALYCLASGLEFVFVVGSVLGYATYLNAATPLDSKIMLSLFFVCSLLGLGFTYVNHVSQLGIVEYTNKLCQTNALVLRRLGDAQGQGRDEQDRQDGRDGRLHHRHRHRDAHRHSVWMEWLVQMYCVGMLSVVPIIFGILMRPDGAENLYALMNGEPEHGSNGSWHLLPGKAAFALAASLCWAYAMIKVTPYVMLIFCSAIFMLDWILATAAEFEFEQQDSGRAGLRALAETRAMHIFVIMFDQHVCRLAYPAMNLWIMILMVGCSSAMITLHDRVTLLFIVCMLDALVLSLTAFLLQFRLIESMTSEHVRLLRLVNEKLVATATVTLMESELKLQKRRARSMSVFRIKIGCLVVYSDRGLTTCDSLVDKIITTLVAFRETQ